MQSGGAPTTASTPPTLRRGIAAGVGVGAAVGLATIGLAFSIVAIPLYTLAQITSADRGLDDPVIRTGLLGFGLPLGLVLGILAGVLVGRWYARGGRLPDWRTEAQERIYEEP